MEKCRQSTKLHLGLLVRGWIFSQQLKLCYQTRTHTRTHTQKRIHFLYGRNHPEFEALLYLRLLQFLPWLTQGLINKKEKEKTGMWAERNYWATFQKKKKLPGWNQSQSTVTPSKTLLTFFHWTQFLWHLFCALCFHCVWRVKDWCLDKLSNRTCIKGFLWQLRFHRLQQLLIPRPCLPRWKCSREKEPVRLKLNIYPVQPCHHRLLPLILMA